MPTILERPIQIFRDWLSDLRQPDNAVHRSARSTFNELSTEEDPFRLERHTSTLLEMCRANPAAHSTARDCLAELELCPTARVEARMTTLHDLLDALDLLSLTNNRNGAFSDSLMCNLNSTDESVRERSFNLLLTIAERGSEMACITASAIADNFDPESFTHLRLIRQFCDRCPQASSVAIDLDLPLPGPDAPMLLVQAAYMSHHREPSSSAEKMRSLVQAAAETTDRKEDVFNYLLSMYAHSDDQRIEFDFHMLTNFFDDYHDESLQYLCERVNEFSVSDPQFNRETLIGVFSFVTVHPEYAGDFKDFLVSQKIRYYLHYVDDERNQLGKLFAELEELIDHRLSHHDSSASAN